MDITANILTANNFLSDDFNPEAILKNIARRMKRTRLELNLTQVAMAMRSGISLGSLKRFEHSGEISLKNLVMIAVAIDATEEFNLLFSSKKYQSIDELLVQAKTKTTKRGRRNV